MGSRGKSGHFFENMARRRAAAALEEQQARFPKEHSGDMLEQLLSYLRRCAGELGHTPNCSEVIGGAYIAKRLGGRRSALLAAGLPRPGPVPKPEHRLIYKREVARQKRLFLEQREAAGQRRQDRQEPPGSGA